MIRTGTYWYRCGECATEVELAVHDAPFVPHMIICQICDAEVEQDGKQEVPEINLFRLAREAGSDAALWYARHRVRLREWMRILRTTRRSIFTGTRAAIKENVATVQDDVAFAAQAAISELENIILADDTGPRRRSVALRLLEKIALWR